MCIRQLCHQYICLTYEPVLVAKHSSATELFLRIYLPDNVIILLRKSVRHVSIIIIHFQNAVMTIIFSLADTRMDQCRIMEKIRLQVHCKLWIFFYNNLLFLESNFYIYYLHEKKTEIK